MAALKAMVVVILLLSAAPVSAMTGQEFLHMYEDDRRTQDEIALLKPLVRQFVKEGYHSVPNWAELGSLAQRLILERGYRDEDILEIAREAALASGMSK
jgi:hypothetical protein